jgi:hypothetical protein
MQDTYSFVGATDIQDKIKTLEDTIVTALCQTVECAIFIHECIGCGFGAVLHWLTETSRASLIITCGSRISFVGQDESSHKCLEASRKEGFIWVSPTNLVRIFC